MNIDELTPEQKQACIELLEWLREPCKHSKPPFFLAHPARIVDCPECMAELESVLKEG